MSALQKTRLEQLAGIGIMRYARLQIRLGQLIDKSAALHNQHPVAHMCDDGQIVADEDIGQERSSR